MIRFHQILSRFAGQAIATSAIALCACAEQAEPPAKQTPPENPPQQAPAEPKSKTAAPAETTPPPAADAPFDPSAIILSASQRQKAEWALLAQMLKENDPTTLSATAANLAVSPASLTNALQALWWGTRGDTALELAKLFGAAPGAAAPAADVATERPAAAVSALGGAVTLSNASALWLDDKFPVRTEYLDLMKQRGLGLAETVDWSQTAEALGRINTWGSQASGGRVTELFAAGDIRPPVAFVLASVVSFKGSWASAFDTDQTRTGDFTLLDGSRRPAAFMNAVRPAGLARIEGMASLLEVPFSDGRHRMIIALPEKAGAAELATMESACAEKMAAWLSEMKSSNVSISLPKFAVGSSSAPRPTLEAVGVQSIFDDRKADFSGASEIAGLKLDAIRHHAKVRIDENGAEAVAATAASVAPKGILPDVTEFRADHPFLFFILGDADELLFAGRVATPESPAE